MFSAFRRWLYPELGFFHGMKGRRAARRCLARNLIRSPGFWFGLLALAQGVMITVAGLSSHPGGPTVRDTVQTVGLLLLVVCIAIFLLILARRSQVREVLRDCLREQGIPICLHCGYDLQGRAGDNCPECGQPHGLARAVEHGNR
jgi:hypothetical protein